MGSQERDLKQKKKSITDQQHTKKQTHSQLLMKMTELRAQIREGHENEKSSEDLIRQRDECQSELSNLEQMKRPLINQKDQLLKEILKLEDLLKKSKAELN